MVTDLIRMQTLKNVEISNREIAFRVLRMDEFLALLIATPVLDEHCQTAMPQRHQWVKTTIIVAVAAIATVAAAVTDGGTCASHRRFQNLVRMFPLRMLTVFQILN